MIVLMRLMVILSVAMASDQEWSFSIVNEMNEDMAFYISPNQTWYDAEFENWIPAKSGLTISGSRQASQSHFYLQSIWGMEKQPDKLVFDWSDLEYPILLCHGLTHQLVCGEGQRKKVSGFSPCIFQRH